MRYAKKLCHGDSDRVDNTIGDGNISREVFESSEGLFSDDNIVDEILSEGTLVDKRLSSEVGEVGSSDRRGRNQSFNDVGSAAVGIERSEVLFVSLDGGVNRGEDGERSGSGDFSGDTGGLKAGGENVEVVVSLKVGLFLSNFNTVSTPDLSGSLKGGKNINGASSSGGGGRGSSGGSSSGRRGGGRSGSSRGGSSRGSIGITHLQVFLERRGSRDTLAGIFVLEGIRVTGISHTTGSKLRSVEEGGGDTGLLRRGEGRSTSNEGGNKGNFALEVDGSKERGQIFCEIASRFRGKVGSNFELIYLQ